jgi:hypothetical protein
MYWNVSVRAGYPTGETASNLNISVRQAQRVKSLFYKLGPESHVHGNAGGLSAELRGGPYPGLCRPSGKNPARGSQLQPYVGTEPRGIVASLSGK